MSVQSKMTAIANATRALDGSTGELTLDGIASKLGVEKTNVDAALAALVEKEVDVPDGSTSAALAELIASIEAGGGDVFGKKFATGTLVLTEETTSEYTLLTKDEVISLGLLGDADNYRKLVGAIYRKPTSYNPTFSNYKNCFLMSFVCPQYVVSSTDGSVSTLSRYVDSSGYTSVRSGNGLSLATNRNVVIKFSADNKGTPDFEYKWIFWGVYI